MRLYAQEKQREHSSNFKSSSKIRREKNQSIDFKVENHYIDNDRVSFRMNDNFSRSGLIEERLYKGGKDAVHLNNESVCLLSIILGDPSGDTRGREIFWPLIMSSRLKGACWNVQGLKPWKVTEMILISLITLKVMT